MKKVLQFIVKKFNDWIEEPIRRPEWYKEAKRIVENNIDYSIIDKNKLSIREARQILRAERLLQDDAKKLFFSLPLQKVKPLSKKILIKKIVENS
jgi:hypothetical protein